MTAAENPLDVLREVIEDSHFSGTHESSTAGMLQARRADLGRVALAAVEQLVEAARAACRFAYETATDQETDAMDDLDAALARFPVPAQDTGGET